MIEVQINQYAGRYVGKKAPIDFQSLDGLATNPPKNIDSHSMVYPLNHNVSCKEVCPLSGTIEAPSISKTHYE